MDSSEKMRSTLEIGAGLRPAPAWAAIMVFLRATSIGLEHLDRVSSRVLAVFAMALSRTLIQ